jgi:hypothetical protein
MLKIILLSKHASTAEIINQTHTMTQWVPWKPQCGENQLRGELYWAIREKLQQQKLNSKFLQYSRRILISSGPAKQVLFIPASSSLYGFLLAVLYGLLWPLLMAVQGCCVQPQTAAPKPSGSAFFTLLNTLRNQLHCCCCIWP